MPPDRRRPPRRARAEARDAQRRAKHELGVEVLLVAGARQERDDDVGVRLLRADERLRVGLAAVELREHLVGRVAAARAVALHLPLAAQLFGRLEVHTHVEQPAEILAVVAEQPFDDRELLRIDAHERAEGAVVVLVDRLQDRLAAAQVHEVLAHHVEVVAVRVQRRDAQLRALAAVVPVVVVDADVRDVDLAEHTYEPAREGCLTGRRVADDAEDDRDRPIFGPPSVRRPLAGRLRARGPPRRRCS